jgi:enoyl-CoA hydratase
LSCDYRIGAPKATFGQPEILLGIIPGGGGTQRLPRLVGPSRAKEIMVTGRQVQSEEALRIGLLDEIVPAEELHVRALALAAQVAAGATVAGALIKHAVDAGLSMSLSDGLSLEKQSFEDVFHSKDSQTGVKSFLENGPGKATFEGK